MDARARDVVELLSNSQSRWRTLRASGREWRHSALLAEAWRTQIARRREGLRRQGGVFAHGTLTMQRDVPELEESEESWQLWMAPPWRRAQFRVGLDTVDVVFRDSTWWSNGHGVSTTNGGAPNQQHGEGYGPYLIRTADWVSRLHVESVLTGTWLGRETLDTRATIRTGEFIRGLDPLHGLVVGDPDDLLLSIDHERGVVLRTEARLQGATYRIVEMTQVAFDKDFPPETFEIRPLPGVDWTDVSEHVSAAAAPRITAGALRSRIRRR